MGQKMSVFVYSPLEYVDFCNNNPEIQNKLESFIVNKLKVAHSINIDHSWKPIINSICHKIKCISEGWEVLPTIHLTITEKGIVCIKKIMDSV
jgi:hypothetical protein